MSAVAAGGAARPAAAVPPGRPAAPAPLRGAELVIGTVALSLATFMNVLDTTIANVSIPAIAGDFGVAPNQGTWVITSFAVANAISVPLTGWLTQRFGAVRLFTASILLFVIASLLCGLAPSLSWLIAFRILQGAVAGPMIPLSQTLLLSSYPPARAGVALSMWSMTTLVAPVVGPLLGGWISDNLTWPWIFFINIPLGIAAAWVTWGIYRRRETATRRVPVDGVGLGLLVVWVGALQLTLDKGKELDWFAAPEIVALAVVAAVVFVLFLIWELTEEHPIVDLKLFARRNLRVATIALGLAYGLFFGSIVLLPLWLQQIVGYNATDAGKILAPVGVFAILLSPWVGKNVQRFDPRWFSTVAMVTFALVMFLRSRFTVEADFATLMIPTVIQGVAMAFFFVPLVSITMSGLPPERIAAASGLTNFTRITCGAIGTSLVTTIWDDRAHFHHARLAEAINPYNDTAQAVVAQLGAGGLTRPQGFALIDRLIDQQAYTLAFDEVFLWASAGFLGLIAVVWLARPIRAPGGAKPAAVDAGH